MRWLISLRENDNPPKGRNDNRLRRMMICPTGRMMIAALPRMMVNFRPTGRKFSFISRLRELSFREADYHSAQPIIIRAQRDIAFFKKIC